MEKIESIIPILVKCPFCGLNHYSIWKWNGIKIYQCRECFKTYIESELCR